MSAIAMKGFLAGYMEKRADESDIPPQNLKGMHSPTTPEEGYPGSTAPMDTPESGMPKPAVPSAADNYGALKGMLKTWMGPAAIGAGAVGAGSMGMDMMRKKKRVAVGKKPVDVKRALLLSVGLGVPLGVASSILYKQGLPGFGQAAGIAGRAGMSAGKGAWAKTKELGAQGLAKGKEIGDKAATTGKQVAQHVVKGPQTQK